MDRSPTRRGRDFLPGRPRRPARPRSIACSPTRGAAPRDGRRRPEGADRPARRLRLLGTDRRGRVRAAAPHRRRHPPRRPAGTGAPRGHSRAGAARRAPHSPRRSASSPIDAQAAAIARRLPQVERERACPCRRAFARSPAAVPAAGARRFHAGAARRRRRDGGHGRRRPRCRCGAGRRR